MGLINRFQQNNRRTADFFRALPPLFTMFRKQTNIPIVKISSLVFCSKFINMVVMFMPLKMLFVLSGSKNIAFLHDIEISLGREIYIGGMLTIISVLYFLNVILQIYQVKLVNVQKSFIEKKAYSFKENIISHKVISKTYPSFCQILADMLLVLVVLIVLFFVNVQYALFYLLMVIVYGIVVEQWAFPLHRTNLMKKLGIDSKQFIQVTGILLYLALFMGILAVVLNTDIVLIVAVLMLIVVRLGNGALKSFFSCQIKLRQHFL